MRVGGELRRGDALSPRLAVHVCAAPGCTTAANTTARRYEEVLSDAIRDEEHTSLSLKRNICAEQARVCKAKTIKQAQAEAAEAEAAASEGADGGGSKEAPKEEL